MTSGPLISWTCVHSHTATSLQVTLGKIMMVPAWIPEYVQLSLLKVSFQTREDRITRYPVSKSKLYRAKDSDCTVVGGMYCKSSKNKFEHFCTSVST